MASVQAPAPTPSIAHPPQAQPQPPTVPSIPTRPLEPTASSLLYTQSSQYRNWRFSADQLEGMRMRGNEAARKRLEVVWGRERDASPLSSTSALPSRSEGGGESSSAPPNPTEIPYLSVSDELALVTFYLVKIGQLTKAFGLPELVEATAMSYMKRFYIRNTCMDWHPKNIMLTCLYLATKTENYPLSITAFATKLVGKTPTPAAVSETERAVLELEFMVSQSLEFEYSCHGAHRALYGVYLDLQSLSPSIPIETLRALGPAARANLSSSRLTDAEFIYTPSQIALASVRMVTLEGNKDAGRQAISRWLDTKQERAFASRKTKLEARDKWRAEERERAARAAAAAAAAKRKVGSRAPAPNSAPSTEEPSESVDDLSRDTSLGVPRADLERVLDEIEALIRARKSGGSSGAGAGKSDVEALKEIDKRLKGCQNPEKVPGTRLYLKRQAELEEAAAAKRAKKAAAAADSVKANGPVDPFADGSDTAARSTNGTGAAGSGGGGGGGGLFAAEIAKKQAAVAKPYLAVDADMRDGAASAPAEDDSDDDDDDNVPVAADFLRKPDAR